MFFYVLFSISIPQQSIFSSNCIRHTVCGTRGPFHAEFCQYVPQTSNREAKYTNKQTNKKKNICKKYTPLHCTTPDHTNITNSVYEDSKIAKQSDARNCSQRPRSSSQIHIINGSKIHTKKQRPTMPLILNAYQIKWEKNNIYL